MNSFFDLTSSFAQKWWQIAKASVYNYQEPPTIELNRLDPTIRENALKILNLSEEEAQDFNKIHQNFSDLTNALETKKSKLPPLFANTLQQIIQDANQAYKTLTNVLKVKPNSTAETKLNTKND